MIPEVFRDYKQQLSSSWLVSWRSPIQAFDRFDSAQHLGRKSGNSIDLSCEYSSPLVIVFIVILFLVGSTVSIFVGI